MKCSLLVDIVRVALIDYRKTGSILPASRHDRCEGHLVALVYESVVNLG